MLLAGIRAVGITSNFWNRAKNESVRIVQTWYTLKISFHFVTKILVPFRSSRDPQPEFSGFVTS